jgi:capsular polysaccharide biosynthesis protein
MRESGSDALGVLRWGLRRYRVLFVACLLLGIAVLPYAASRLVKPADAEALVITQRLDMDLTALPRYGEAIFNNGEVAQAVAAQFGDGGDMGDVIPDRVSLVADQDSIVYRVVGHDPDPQTAADIANAATTTFIEALNVPGVGVGAFALLSPAEPPAAPGRGVSRLVAVPVGVATGVVLGLALVSILLVVRRPVIDPAGVEEATGVRSLGTVTLPRTRRGQFARTDDFRGLIPVCRRLLRLKTPTIVLVSRSRDEGVRQHVSVALTDVLMRIREVRLTGPAHLQQVIEDRRAGLAPNAERSDRSDAGALTVVDSTDPLDLVQPPELTAAVLVAREGVSSAALRGAVLDHLGGSAEACVLLVKRGRRSRSGSRLPRKAAADREQADDVALAESR